MSTARDSYTFKNSDSIPPEVEGAIANFLRQWDDTTDKTHAYLEAFAHDATLDLAPEVVTGHDSIKVLRNSMIDHINGPIVGVQHTFHKLYLLAGHENGGDGKDLSVCLTGNVAYTVKGGKVVEQRFSTTFDLVSVGQREYSIKLARIYMDNSLLMAALAELATKKQRWN